jgi:hypothetical protein
MPCTIDMYICDLSILAAARVPQPHAHVLHMYTLKGRSLLAITSLRRIQAGVISNAASRAALVAAVHCNFSWCPRYTLVGA